MKTACSWVLLVLLAGANRLCFAQPTVSRVEEGVRRQLAAPTENGPAAAAPKESGYLGVVAEPDLSARGGVRIRESVAGGPAAVGGLAAGDVITAINSQPLRTIAEMSAILQPLPPGAKIDFQVIRGGQRQSIAVTLGVRPSAPQRGTQQFGTSGASEPSPAQRAGGSPSAVTTRIPPRLGVRTDPVTDEDRARLNFSGGGAKITSLTVGSSADKAGLPLGAIITAVDGQPIESPAHMAALIKRVPAGGTVDLTYFNSGGQYRKQIVLASAPAAAGATVTTGLPTPAAGADRPPTLDRSNAAAGDPALRVAALERRIKQLEDRIRQLEDAMRAAGSQAPAPK